MKSEDMYSQYQQIISSRVPNLFEIWTEIQRFSLLIIPDVSTLSSLELNIPIFNEH
jgi:hypothetical protein